jgi:hypothetical protein
MADQPKSRGLLTWLALVLITLASWGLGNGAGPAATGTGSSLAFTVLLLAFIKLRLIMRHFMEVRMAPAVLRWICDAWLACAYAALAVTYYTATPG